MYIEFHVLLATLFMSQIYGLIHVSNLWRIKFLNIRVIR